MELLVVIHASEEQEAIAQSRRLGLTGVDIVYIYIYKWSNNRFQQNQ